MKLEKFVSKLEKLFDDNSSAEHFHFYNDVAEQTPDYFTQAEIERLQAQKQEYMILLDCIEQEQADLQAEYKQASVKRRTTISSKLTSLASRHAATNKTLSGIDSKIEKLYNQ